MAKRRTKKQKKKTSQRRKTTSTQVTSAAKKTESEVNDSQQQAAKGSVYHLPSNSKSTKKSQQKPKQSLLRVDPRYLKLDLVRSVIITCILVIALIGIYLYMRYN